MSLKPEKIGPIPAQTITVAQAAFPKSTLCMRIRDEIGPLFEDTAFAQLFSKNCPSLFHFSFHLQIFPTTPSKPRVL